MQLNALFCCLWRNVEASCHKHFRRRVPLSTPPLTSVSVTACGTVERRRRIDNTWPVAALTAGSEAKHRLRIAISAYPILHSTRMWLPDGDKILKMFTRFDRMCKRDGQTDTQTPHGGIGRPCIASRGKNVKKMNNIMAYSTSEIACSSRI